ncbi:hypothetical protein QR680_004300 [Steinernema hermaphroditum]|uniref:WH1 domain-containing protein n=1 Tax=Steinernema hermaphroditum TaxID=289476 RepID=A0AA39HQG8_9BILA|nr:hypothetical protein QR680_004300 [Steinernema hermaphroditum]
MDRSYRRSHRTDSAKTKKKPRPANKGSSMMTDSENQQLFALLGSESVSLCVAMIYLMVTRGGDRLRWTVRGKGALVFIKDYARRIYTLQLLDIRNKCCMWEQTLTKNFHAQCDTDQKNLITFEDEKENYTYGLNFANVEEAEKFKLFFERFEKEQNKPDRKKSACVAGIERELRPWRTSGSTTSSIGLFSSMASSVQTQDRSTTSRSSVFGLTRFMQNLSVFSTSSRRKEKAKSKKDEIDLSSPKKFERKPHITRSELGSLQKLDNNVKNVFAAPCHKSELTRPRQDDLSVTSNFTSHFKFVDSNANTPTEPTDGTLKRTAVGVRRTSSSVAAFLRASSPPGLAPVRSYRARGRPAPPPPTPNVPRARTSVSPAEPVTLRTLLEQMRSESGLRPRTPHAIRRPRVSPPPPPTTPVTPFSKRIPTPMPSEIDEELYAKRAPSPCPPTETAVLATSGAKGPPPAPPCPPLSMLKSSATRLEATKTSKSASRVTITRSVTMATASSAREDMMKQIREGTKLKAVTPQENPRPTFKNVGFVAGALARALTERRNRVLCPSSDSESDTGHNDSEWNDN